MDRRWSLHGDSGLRGSPDADGPLHTVHLLDPHSDRLLFLNEVLSRAGFRVTASSDTTDALQAIARTHPEVLIADKDMPDCDGMDLLEQVRLLSPATRVVLTTERADQGPGDREMRTGGADLLVKPFKVDLLRRAVERAIRK